MIEYEERVRKEHQQRIEAEELLPSTWHYKSKKMYTKREKLKKVRN